MGDEGRRRREADVADPFEILSDEERRVLRRARPPRWISPMLATLTRDTFSDPEWLYERKLDGVRCLVFRRPRALRLLSRNRTQMNETYPELVEELEQQACGDFVADGEIVAFEGRRTSFSRLQQRIGIHDPEQARRSGVVVYLYLFDLLHLEGLDLSKLGLRSRKRLLKRALSFGGHLRFTPHRVGRGEAYLEEACRKGWEGLIAKRASSTYEHSRSRAWLKFKCGNRQELVIGGYTDPRGSRKGFGALLVGYYEGGRLRYAGKVGTGYDDQLLEELGERLGGMERRSAPFAEEPRERGVHWVSPKLVAEIGFTEWTEDGKLRHPRFLGLREDKAAKQVRRERARPAPL
jgi:bifunctional non-homologous end joining protein LigD